jgi:rhodanese-related sulfurtransferase
MTLTETIKKMSPKSAFNYFDQKLKFEIGPVELKRKMDEKETGFELIDVRSREAYEGGHIPGAKMIPFEEFTMRLPEFSEYRENIVYCYNAHCQLADKAARWLAEKGFSVKLLSGGFDVWEKFGHPVEK